MMSAHDFFTMVASVVAALIAILLSSISSRLARMEEKLDQKQDIKECEVRETRCCKSVSDLWDAFGKHSHEGLPKDSKVTR